MNDASYAALQRAGGLLQIDLGALAGNYRILCAQVGPHVAVGAAVKANAYGLGVQKVAPALYRAGCRRFFVATVDEGLSLAPSLPIDSTICILNGPPPGSEADLLAAGLVPVLNSLAQIRCWAALARHHNRRLPCLLQLDSGMSRFGLSESDLHRVLADTLIASLDIHYVMSHLACADDTANDRNEGQRSRFDNLRAFLPPLASSLAASSGIFLGKPYHYDLVRPGYALYGGNPVPGQVNPMAPVVSLHACLVQDRQINPGVAVGYSARFLAERRSRIGTLAVGYADGFPRRAGGIAHAVLPDAPEIPLPIIGRISMDCMALDLTALGDRPLAPGTAFELIGPNRPLDVLAHELDTIGYEVLTALGQRHYRNYIESAS